jgi:hypothetical protein
MSAAVLPSILQGSALMITTSTRSSASTTLVMVVTGYRELRDVYQCSLAPRHITPCDSCAAAPARPSG